MKSIVLICVCSMLFAQSDSTVSWIGQYKGTATSVTEDVQRTLPAILSVNANRMYKFDATLSAMMKELNANVNLPPVWKPSPFKRIKSVWKMDGDTIWLNINSVTPYFLKLWRTKPCDTNAISGELYFQRKLDPIQARRFERAGRAVPTYPPRKLFEVSLMKQT